MALKHLVDGFYGFAIKGPFFVIVEFLFSDKKLILFGALSAIAGCNSGILWFWIRRLKNAPS